ncbi:MAG: hypothetical protein GC162_10875 [Planctomycetes bacterium]|nr:hypothetical protein [Planctomycetota bacterium]
MPIEPIPTAASLIDDDELMREVVKRFSASAIMLSSLLDRAERIDWEAAAAAMDENPNAREDDYDAKTEAAIDVADAMYLLITNTIDRFDSALIACDSRAVKFGEVDQRKGPLREWFFDRANAIYSRLTATDNARSTFMARLMGRAHVNEPDMIIGRLEEALTRYGV